VVLKTVFTVQRLNIIFYGLSYFFAKVAKNSFRLKKNFAKIFANKKKRITFATL